MAPPTGQILFLPKISKLGTLYMTKNFIQNVLFEHEPNFAKWTNLALVSDLE